MRWFAAAQQGAAAESWGKQRSRGKNGIEASSRHRRQRGSPSDAAKLASGLAERAMCEGI